MLFRSTHPTLCKGWGWTCPLSNRSTYVCPLVLQQVSAEAEGSTGRTGSTGTGTHESALVLDEDGGVIEAILTSGTLVGALSHVGSQVGALHKALPALGAFIGSLPQGPFGPRALCVVPEVPSSLGGGVPVVP